jgi:hypothetical protein
MMLRRLFSPPTPAPAFDETRSALSERIDHMTATAVGLGIDDRLRDSLAAARAALLRGDIEGTRRFRADRGGARVVAGAGLPAAIVMMARFVTDRVIKTEPPGFCPGGSRDAPSLVFGKTSGRESDHVTT